MRRLRTLFALLLAALMVVPQGAFASNHREAPITALDHKADITDLYAFVSYSANQAPNTPPSKVTLILCVDPFLEPGNGPTWFPFDPDILYEIKIDNSHDAGEDVVFQFRFTTEQRQSYTVTMVKNGVATQLTNANGSPFFAVPTNVGPRTIDYPAVFQAGTYTQLSVPGVSVFAGTVDDPFWIDLGAAFDTANLRSAVGGGVLTPAQDAANQNFASDTVSGYAVNAIAIEVPIEMVTSTGRIEPSSSPAAVIGVWGTTSRPRVTVRRSPNPALTEGPFRQVQRIGNPLINELLIGSGSKDRFSMDQPKNDSQFANFFLDPVIARVLNALTSGVVAIPTPPRFDLLPLVTYAAPICPGCGPSDAGPIADLLRLNTGVPATPLSDPTYSRLGLIGGDRAGYPNGRRLQDDVVDITLRVGVGGVLIPAFNKFPNNRLGDGVNVNDAAYRTAFPYLADCPSGRDRRHLDPGEPGCTAGAGAPCAP